MAWVYILLCADGTYYVGSTIDRERRLWEHNESPLGAAYPKKRRPVQMIWSADFPSIAQAFAFEKKICRWSRAKKEALMRGDYDELVALSRRKPVQDRAADAAQAEGR